MVAEQITSSGSSPWEEIGDDVEQKLSGMKRAKMSGKKGKSKRGEELRSSAPVGARDAVTSESKLSSQNLAQANPEPETKVFDMEAPTSSTPEPILNNTSDVEVGKRRGEKKPVGSPMSRRRRNSNPERGREKPQEGVEESLPISTVSEEVLEVKEEKAEEIENGVSKPEVSEVPGDISEDAEKTEAPKEDDIVEGFGAVSEKVSENVFGETMDLKPNIPVISEKKERNGGEESSLEGEYLPAGEESLQELRERIKTLKHSADESRNRFLALRHRNTSKWLAIKKALFPLRSKEPPESMVNELNLLKSDWTHKLTLYKDAVVELAKRGVAQRELGGKTQGELMAEAIRGLDLQGSIENYDAWKNASWGDRKDSGFLRALGRARDWAEQYRKLDWKKRVAISAAVVGTGVAGVAVGSAGLVGLGVAGSTLVRLLGAYGAGRGSYEFLEGRAAQKTLKYHEAALSHVEKIKDIGFLEQRMKSYADRTQQDLDRAIAGNRKRVIASVALGSALFLGGTAFAHRSAIQEFSGKVSSGFSKFLEQAKIISGLEDFHAAPISITGAGDGVTEAVSSVSPPMGVESGGIASDVVGAGMINHDVAAEIAGKIGKDIHETVLVQKDSSVEATLIKFLTEQHGINKEDAQGIAHRIANNYVNTHPVSMQELSLVQPDTKLGIIPNPDNAKMPFKLSSVEFAPTSGAGTVAGAPVEVPVVEPAVAELTPLEPVHVSEIQPAVQLEPMNPISLPESGNLPSSLEPPDAFDKYGKRVAVAGAAIGAAASAVGGGALAWSEIAKMRERSQSKEKQEEKEKKKPTLTQEKREELKRKSENIFDQVISLSRQNLSDDRKKALRRIREGYAAFSGAGFLKDDIFEETQKNIKTVFFGSEAVSEKLLAKKFSDVVKQDKSVGLGVKNAYIIFQGLFLRAGERLPGNIVDRSVGDVLRLITERFLTGQIPEEFESSIE